MSNPTLAPEALAAWNDIASFWDSQIGKDGNKYWRKLQEPSLSRLLGPILASKPGCRALELATGNGLCARWLAARGAEVLATDGSEKMVEIARTYYESKDGEGAGEGKGKIEFRRLDVTSGEEFGVLGMEERSKGLEVSACHR